MFEKTSKRYLKNAVIYYYRAIKDIEAIRLEEALIDLMISLESLISRERMELSYRLSLRTAKLLSINKETDFSKSYSLVKDMYAKRSKIIHGDNDVKLSQVDINEFKKLIKKAILYFIYIDQDKNKIIELIDNSIINKACEKYKLKEIIKNARANFNGYF